MAIKYYLAKNTGKGFITHEDQAVAQISGHPGDIWTTDETNSTWAVRVGALEKTKDEAQAICDATIVDETGSRLRVIESISSSIDSNGEVQYFETYGSDLQVYSNLP